MKTVLILLVFCFIASTVFAGEIIPTVPIVITQPAVKIIDYSITFTPQDITVKFNWYEVGGSIVKEQYVTINGNDFTTLMNAAIQAGQVGQKFSDIMFKAIRNKCKTILAIEGTVN